MTLALMSVTWLQPAAAVSPTPEEMAAAKQWAEAARPFSFVCDGKPSSELLDAWEAKRATRKLDAERAERTLTWTDPKTGLEVRCVSVEYSDFPLVEWTIYLRNTGTADTPLLENIQAINARWERPDGGEFVLRGSKGDFCTPDSYEPYEITLGPDAVQKFVPDGGRPTNRAFPYYNLTMPGGGMILAVGWPGQWAASFSRDGGNGLEVVAGQELTHLRLKPGEEIRTPLVAILFWKGADSVRAQNLWRRWMLAHNLPRPSGKPLKPMYSFCTGGFYEGLKVSEASEKLFFDALTKEGIRLDYWWMDAGWYPCDPEGWPKTGTWEVDKARFPNGIRAVSDYVHAKGTKLILWFEPERVTAGSWLATQHPDWLLGGVLLNLGNPNARRWLTDHVDKLLTEQGIDLYRQDFNMDPLGYWRGADAPDRQGMTENLHVQGYLAYWDELLRRHPGMLIDSCASGGRRNDLETMRRAVPLLRSDYQSFTGEPQYAAGNQGHTYGLSSWIPFYGQGNYDNPQFEYYARSHMCPSFAMCVDVRKGHTEWDRYRRVVHQWRQISPCFLGDFYPLTPYSLGEDRWIAWQFDCPERGEGVVQAFRRAQCPEESLQVQLHGVEPNAVYTLTNLDVAGATEVSGRELLEKGISLVLKDQPGSAVIIYKKKG
jgi:alpha-galactosidase